MKKLIYVCFFILLVSVFNIVLEKNEKTKNVSVVILQNEANAQTEWYNLPVPQVGPGKVATWDRCVIDLGGGWFRSGVEKNCWDCYVCPSCECDPLNCSG